MTAVLKIPTFFEKKVGKETLSRKREGEYGKTETGDKGSLREGAVSEAD